MDTFTHNGLNFRVETEQDCDHGAPWEEEDGHGPVSEWTRSRAQRWAADRTGKRPGERVLIEDRGSFRFYDWQEAIAIAKRDGWGVSDDVSRAFLAKHGREMTKGEIAHASVTADFERLRAWCDDQWGYVGVIVTLLDVEGDAIESQRDSLWGIESDSGDDYMMEVARDCAANIAANIPKRARVIKEESRGRITVYRIRN